MPLWQYCSWSKYFRTVATPPPHRTWSRWRSCFPLLIDFSSMHKCFSINRKSSDFPLPHYSNTVEGQLSDWVHLRPMKYLSSSELHLSPPQKEFSCRERKFSTPLGADSSLPGNNKYDLASICHTFVLFLKLNVCRQDRFYLQSLSRDLNNTSVVSLEGWLL